MIDYYVDKLTLSTGEHEVHVAGCPNMPILKNCISLGRHMSCYSAITAAQKFFTKVDGCVNCASDCHSR